ncbi:MAG: selenocysteine-specific translation elongation factor, partial [Caldisericales bacterium]|nr:selenocysteine-specific translation elongation factor [Caldisericales bacterium]
MIKRSFIVGTAGHVDHGKSTLVTRLTGTDPDRLPEEKARQMTIELGFAKLDLPSGRMCGIVDVPGHEKLVKQMLMGAQGFDLVMFTVACDEGPKRQTYEHLSILDMIGIRVGVIVLTKCDLPHDDAILQSQLDSMLANTSLEAMPRIKVSAYTGEGIDKLRQAIDDLLDHATPRPLNMPAFYPVDRVFTVKGFGIVTTGTLWQGQVKKGEELEIFPSRGKGKLRGIESFDAQIETGDAGSRLALNFQNLDKEDITRGNILATPGRFDPTTEFDAKIRLIEKVKRRTRLKFHYATIEQEVDYSDIGGGYARIKLEGPLPLTKGSRFILRSIAPADTVGGGEVVDLHPKGKLNAPETLQ